MVSDEVLQHIENSQFLVLPQLLQLLSADGISSLFYLYFVADSEVRVVMRVILQQIVLNVLVWNIHLLVFLLPVAGSHPN